MRNSIPFGPLRTLLYVLLICRPAAAEPAPPAAADPPQGRFDDQWMAILLGGQKLGYMHSESTREGDRIHSRTRTVLKVQRAGTPLQITMTLSNTESITGVPLAFASEEHFSEFPIRKSGTVRDGVIALVTEQFGQRFEQQIPYPQGALMAWGLQLESLKHPPEPGTKFGLQAFVPSQALNVGIPMTVEVLGREDIELLGRTVPALKTRTNTVLSGAAIETIGWVDQRWRPLKQQLELMGLKFEMVACDQTYAMKDLSSPEMFVNSLIPIGRSIDRDKVRSITFKIAAVGDAEIPEFPETEMQKVVDRKKGELILKVTRLDLAGLENTAIASPPPNFSNYIEPSVFITSTDPQVTEMARAAVGSERQPYKTAIILCRKVADEIAYKDLSTAFATAAEVCRNRSGDCTEHGVLLAALGRARGIPTRLVSGLIYVPRAAGQVNVMGFHMWTQYWINGRWIDLDAAWGQTDVDPTHIALGTHSAEHGTIGGLVSAVMLKLGDFRIEVVDVQLSP